MQLVLMTNTSPGEVIGKDLTTVATINGTWKEDSGILQPILIINTRSLNNVNYFYLPEFGRYYYLKNPKTLTGGRIQIEGLVDALESWKDYIKLQSAIIARQAYKWNLYLDDQNYKIYSNPNIQLLEYPNGFTTQELVLAVAGGGDTNEQATKGQQQDTVLAVAGGGDTNCIGVNHLYIPGRLSGRGRWGY